MKEKLFNFVGLINSLLEEMEKQNENISKIVSLYPTTNVQLQMEKSTRETYQQTLTEKNCRLQKVTMETYQKSTH